MPTPRRTAEGVKPLCGDGSLYWCGHCQAVLIHSWGFPQAGVTCERCGTHNRCDLSTDLASERLDDIASYLRDHRLAPQIARIAEEVRGLEETARIVFGGQEPMSVPHT